MSERYQCSHVRQWVPEGEGRSHLLPCAYPGCLAGCPGVDLKIAEPARLDLFTSAATFFEDARAYDNAMHRTARYVRERKGDHWRWIGPIDPWGRL